MGFKKEKKPTNSNTVARLFSPVVVITKTYLRKVFLQGWRSLPRRQQQLSSPVFLRTYKETRSHSLQILRQRHMHICSYMYLATSGRNRKRAQIAFLVFFLFNPAFLCKYPFKLSAGSEIVSRCGAGVALYKGGKLFPAFALVIIIRTSTQWCLSCGDEMGNVHPSSNPGLSSS